MDYVLASEPIFDCITSFKVHDPNSLSDHCLIEYMFENTCTLEKRDAHSTDVNGSPVNWKYKWKPERRTDFINGLNSEGFIDQLYNLTVYTSSCLSEVDINSSISQFSDLLSPVTDDLFKCSSSSGNTADTTTYNTNKHQDSQNA